MNPNLDTQVEQAKLVTADMMATTPKVERIKIFGMLKRQGVPLPVDCQAALLSIAAAEARTAAETNMNFKGFLTCMCPWSENEQVAEFDPLEPLASSIASAKPQTRWGWFQKTVVEETLVEYIAQGEQMKDTVVQLSKAMVELFEGALAYLTDEFFVKMVDVAIGVARVLPPMVSPTVEDLANCQSDAASLKVAMTSKGSSVRVCVAVAIASSPFWSELLSQFVDAAPKAVRFADEVAEATSQLRNITRDEMRNGFADHMVFLKSQCERLTFYQAELIEGSYNDFQDAVLEFAELAHEVAMDDSTDNEVGFPYVRLKDFATVGAELLICLPHAEKVNTMVEEARKRLSDASQGQAQAAFLLAASRLARAAVPANTTGDVWKEECAEFLKAHNDFQQLPPAAKNVMDLHWLIEAYHHVIGCMVMVKDNKNSAKTLTSCGLVLQGILKPFGQSHGEVDLYQLAMEVNEFLEGWRDETVIPDDEDYVHPPEQRQTAQRYRQQIHDAGKALGPDAHYNVVLMEVAKGIDAILTECVAAAERRLIHRTKTRFDAAVTDLHRWAGGVENGDWDENLPGRLAWQRFRDHCDRVFAGFDPDGLGNSITEMSQAHCAHLSHVSRASEHPRSAFAPWVTDSRLESNYWFCVREPSEIAPIAHI